jgi:hypothetical protein
MWSKKYKVRGVKGKNAPGREKSIRFGMTSIDAHL